MNNFFKIVTICIVTCITHFELNAQVTIGVSDAPMPGALLDLKQENNATGGATSKLGLGLPRVKLTDKDNLFPMFTGITDYTGTYKHDQDLLHIGLLVYNVDACTLSGKGMYVWTKNGWEILGDATGGGGLNISPSSLLFYNGLLNSKKDLTVSWVSTGSDIPVLTTDKANLNFDITGSGTVSPIVYSVSVPDMDPTEIQTNPFLLKAGKLTFKLSNSPCGDGGVETKIVDIQQINKALELSSRTIYTSNTVKDGKVTVESNANWSMTGILPILNPVTSVILDGSKVGGLIESVDLKSGTTIEWDESEKAQKGGSGSITVTVGATNPNRYNYITLADAETPKRFLDISLAVLQCGSTNNPSMDEWINMAGLLPSSPNVSNANGTQWHYDQSGNKFISGKFGTWENGKDRRWMITNLGAKDFARDNRTGDDKEIKVEWGFAYNIYDKKLVQYGTVPSLGAALSTGPMWAYPTGDGKTDDGLLKNPRIGCMYNWAGATNSYSYEYKDKAGSVLAGDPGRFTGYNKRQGICPNGWHLPSFSETVDFLNEILENTSTYSSSANQGIKLPSVPNGKSYNFTETLNEISKENSTVSVPLKDYCSINSTTAIDKLQSLATSNPISSAQVPGFNASFCGFGASNVVQTADAVAYYWLFSLQNFATNHGTAMFFTSESRSLMISSQNMSTYFSVRCVQDYDE